MSIRSLGRPLLNAGAPVGGTNEVQTLTIGGTPTGGTFKLKFDGLTTGAITWSATNATLLANIDAALEALPNVGTGGVTCAEGSLTAGIGTITITFGGNLAKLAVSTITVANNSLTGTSPTLAVAETTPGVTATGRGALRGKQLVDTSSGTTYVNTSNTPLQPTWAQIEGSGGVATADLADGVLSADATGRAKMADDFFNAAAVLAKFDADSFTNAVLLLLVQDGAFAADAATRALFANAFLTKAKAAVFASTEQTGTGSAQNVAHGLAAVPALVMVSVTESDGNAFDVAEGAHDSTNVVVTVTSGVKFKVLAWA